MTFHNQTTLCAGDTVSDPIDGQYRHIRWIDWSTRTAYMEDGGCLSVDECQDIYLDNEADSIALNLF